jgi:hypothetical protein
MKKQTLLTLMLLAVATGLAGCGGGGTSWSSVKWDLTPELQGMTRSSDMIDKDLHTSMNMNKRMFWDDIGRALYTDQPSRLSPLPTTSLSGTPR